MGLKVIKGNTWLTTHLVTPPKTTAPNTNPLQPTSHFPTMRFVAALGTVTEAAWTAPASAVIVDVVCPLFGTHCRKCVRWRETERPEENLMRCSNLHHLHCLRDRTSRNSTFHNIARQVTYVIVQDMTSNTYNTINVSYAKNYTFPTVSLYSLDVICSLTCLININFEVDCYLY